MFWVRWGDIFFIITIFPKRTIIGYYILIKYRVTHIRLVLTVLAIGRSYGSELSIVFVEEVLFELCQDVFAVRVLFESVDVGPDVVHEDLPLSRLGHVNHLLDDIVGVLVLHHQMQRTQLT